MPDFQKPIISEGVQILYPYEGFGKHVLLPDSLKLAERDDRSPDFLLEYVKGSEKELLKSYGILDFRVTPSYSTDKANRILKEKHPDATIEHSYISSGKLVIYAIGGKCDISDNLISPIPMIWNVNGVARLFFKISDSHAALIEESLKSHVFPFQAYAELMISGVSPRVPTTVAFNPKSVMDALESLGDENRIVKLSEVLKAFTDFVKDPSSKSLPIEISDKDCDFQDFSEAIVDRLIQRFCSYIIFPPPQGSLEPYISLPSKGKLQNGSFVWDLSEPQEVERAFVLSLAPLDAVKDWTNNHQDLDGIFKKIEVPKLKGGCLELTICSPQLFNKINNLHMIEVRLTTPPNPPYRKQEKCKCITLTPQINSVIENLVFSISEKPIFSYQTFAHLKFFGDRIPGIIKEDYSSSSLILGNEDLPIDIKNVEASSELLKVSTIQGSISWLDTENRTVDFDLSTTEPSVRIAYPKIVNDISYEIKATLLDNSKSLMTTGKLSSRTKRFDLSSFAEYGSHKIEIECIFGEDKESIQLDFMQEDSQGKTTTLHFASENPKKSWVYFASSPFFSGYKFREHRGQNQVQNDWSEIKSAFEKLVIEV